MLTEAGSILGTAFDTLRRSLRGRRPQAIARCRRFEVHSEAEVGRVAFAISRRSASEIRDTQDLLRGLAELNTPSLYLDIVQQPTPCRIILQPWDGRMVRFRGRSYIVCADSGAPEGVEAFIPVPGSRMTALYPTTPDHPVHVISIEHQGEKEIRGWVPPWLTHVTIVVNGRVITRAERLLRERGRRVWAA